MQSRWEPSFERDLPRGVHNVFPFVNRTPIAFAVSLCCLVASARLPVSGAAAPAAVSSPELDVSTVKFATVHPSVGVQGNWLEADISLDARPAPSSLTHMISRVKVTLTVGFELPAPAGGERKLEFYRATAECVALEAGRADVRFYLPPELVKRDQLFGEPKYWGVELMAAGKPIPTGRNGYSATLPTAENRKNFLTRAVTTALANDGLLIPQYLTPFANDYPRSTPSFVRREGP